MYIIEKLIRFFQSAKVEKPMPQLSEGEVELEDYMKCSHTFLPIDSTGEVFACSKCGFVTAKKVLKKSKKKKY